MSNVTGHADLGRIVVHIHLSSVPYETYLQGQKLIASYFAQLNRSAARLTSIMSCLFVFAATLYITSSFPSRYAAIVIFILTIGSIILITVSYYQKSQLYKKIYNSLDDADCDIYFGENGIFIKIANYSVFFCWSSLVEPIRNKHGLFLIMKNIQVISIPEDDLKQMPQADALLEFIVSKGNSPAFA